DRAYHQSQQHKRSLQCIRKYNGFNAALKSVQNDHQQNNNGGKPKGHSEVIEDEDLENVDNKIQPGCCTQRPGDDKEQGACFIGDHSEALLQVIIDGSEI